MKPVDPQNAVDVLAFVFCPTRCFAPDGDEEELEAVEEIMLPMKEEAIDRWRRLRSN